MKSKKMESAPIPSPTPISPEVLSRRAQGRLTFSSAWQGVRGREKTKENSTEQIILPKVSIPADSDSIQNQQIGVVDEGERVAVMFKMNIAKWQT